MGHSATPHTSSQYALQALGNQCLLEVSSLAVYVSGLFPPFLPVSRRDRPRRNEAGLGVTPLTGLKGLGVREMSFKICLLAVDVQTEGESRREQINQDTKEVCRHKIRRSITMCILDWQVDRERIV